MVKYFLKVDGILTSLVNICVLKLGYISEYKCLKHSSKWSGSEEIVYFIPGSINIDCLEQ